MRAPPTAAWLVGVASAAAVGIALGWCYGACAKSQCPCTLARVGCWLRGKARRTKYPQRLILVRHGQSEGNVDPSLYCNVPDHAMHLTPLGFEQAVAAGECIKEIVGDQTVRFIVSPYVRTLETFESILQAWGDAAQSIPWKEERRIREQDFGNFQDPVKIREYKAQRRRFGSFFYRFPCGESPADVYDRVSSFLESLFRLFEKTLEQNYVLVTHGVAIRVILKRYFKYRVSEFERLDNFHNGEFVVLEMDARVGRYQLAKLVHNNVRLESDGSVDIEKHESNLLRLTSMQAALPMPTPPPSPSKDHPRRHTSSTRMHASSSSLEYPLHPPPDRRSLVLPPFGSINGSRFRCPTIFSQHTTPDLASPPHSLPLTTACSLDC